MASPEGPGAAAEAKRRRKWHIVLGGSGAAGFGTGLAFAFGNDSDGFASGTLPPWLAVVLAAIYFALMIFGTVAMKRMTDELERHANLYGLAMGASAVMLVYPPWWFLWRGTLVPEPSHELLFLLLLASALAAYLWKKYR